MQFEQLKRRGFITLIGGATAWPLVAHTQPPAMPVIGVLSITSASQFAQTGEAFKRGLREAGFIEGQNTGIDYRWAEGENNRLPALASELVYRQVNVMAAFAGLPGVRAVMAATTSIPIVFQTGVDPVQAGLVASLRRPGGNVTGVTTLGNEVAPKRLELLHELLPTATEIAVLINRTNPNAETSLRDLQAAARDDETLRRACDLLHT
jgi:putative ABC transport system substrate-binding protein